MIEPIMSRLGYVPKAELEKEMHHCCECDGKAEHVTQRAPGMGVDYWCPDCCPVCNQNTA